MSDNTKKKQWTLPVLEEIAIADTAGKRAGKKEAGGNNKKTSAGS